MQDRVLVVVIDGLGFDPTAERNVMQSVMSELTPELQAGLRRQLAGLIDGEPWQGQGRNRASCCPRCSLRYSLPR